jgi:hypothetical protein
MGKILTIALITMASSAANALVRCDYYTDPNTGRQEQICYQEDDGPTPGVPDNCQYVVDPETGEGTMYCN